MARLSVWVLLGLALFTLSVHDYKVKAEVPTEYECRPYIEKALHELRTGEPTSKEELATEEASSTYSPIDVTSQEEEDNTAAEETSIEQDVPEPELLTPSEEVQEALFDDSTEQPAEGSEENAEEEEEEVTEEETADAEEEAEELEDDEQADEAVTESQEQEAEAAEEDVTEEVEEDEATSAEVEEADEEAALSEEAVEEDDDTATSQEDATLSEEATEDEENGDADAEAEQDDDENGEAKDEDDEDKTEDDADDEEDDETTLSGEEEEYEEEEEVEEEEEEEEENGVGDEEEDDDAEQDDFDENGQEDDETEDDEETEVDDEEEDDQTLSTEQEDDEDLDQDEEDDVDLTEDDEEDDEDGEYTLSVEQEEDDADIEASSETDQDQDEDEDDNQDVEQDEDYEGGDDDETDDDDDDEEEEVGTAEDEEDESETLSEETEQDIDDDDEPTASAEEEEGEEEPLTEVDNEAAVETEASPEVVDEASPEVEEEPTAPSEEVIEESTEAAEEVVEEPTVPVEELASEEAAVDEIASTEDDQSTAEVVPESAELVQETTAEESAEEAEAVSEPITEEVSEEIAEKVETTPEEAVPASDDTVEVVSQESVEESEPLPEEDLLLEYEIPSNLRDTSHIYELLHINDQSTEKEQALQKVADVILRDLKKTYDTAIKPLETLYKYRDLSNRHFGDPEIFSKPLVLFMGPWSGGKSTILNYLTHNEYTPNSVRTGAEPSPAYFNILMHGDEPEVLDGTQLAADWTFSGLQKFGQGLLDRLRGHKLPNKLLERVNIVEIPGILEVRKQVSQYFPFNDACQWFIDRADIIFLVYDPSKLDVGPETEAILDQLKGREYQTRILLNKADQVKPEELLRVQGALIWNISPLMSSAQPPVMYTVSLWSNPYETGAPVRLLQAQERSLLLDLGQAIDKRIENKIASARRFAVRVRNHAKMVDCYLTTYYNHKTLFANKKQISEQIIGNPQQYHIYEGLSTLTNISRYDLPDPDVYRDFFHLNPLYEFQKLSETCTYFRGCPINKLDIAIAYDLPELVGKYKKMADAALEKLQIPSPTTDFGRGKSSS
ncbi:serine-aspartate repeat-containing protein F isoform X1 [Armigeres subalbatus]|uniref:serine-aspartate repeat-containing protein F isoform X1 n=1 Tax=Armigeres subalbatus TaxID=124917 RepID=UPI002ED20947